MIDILQALGCRDERPLQVGDFTVNDLVELVDPQPAGVDSSYTKDLARLSWPRKVTGFSAAETHCEIDGLPFYLQKARFRRVEPPKDEVAELRKQLEQVTRERDEWKVRYGGKQIVEGEVNATIHGLIAERNKLSDQLAAAQSEAAAMREAIELAGEGLAEYADGSEIIHAADCPHDDTCDCAHLRKLTEAQRLMHKCINSTAGRELRDKHAREIATKDAEIAQLLARLETPAEEPKPAETVWQYRKGRAAMYRYNGSAFEALAGSLGWCRSLAYTNWQACCEDPETYPCDENGKRIAGPSRGYLSKMADAEDQCQSVTAISPELLAMVDCEHDTSGTPCQCNPIIEDYSDHPKCESCGVRWDAHMGMISQCKMLQECKPDAELCRQLRVLLPPGYGLSTAIGVVRLECKNPLKLFELLINIRDGGAA